MIKSLSEKLRGGDMENYKKMWEEIYKPFATNTIGKSQSFTSSVENPGSVVLRPDNLETSESTSQDVE
jgi:hypothetical protein